MSEGIITYCFAIPFPIPIPIPTRQPATLGSVLNPFHIDDSRRRPGIRLCILCNTTTTSGKQQRRYIYGTAALWHSNLPFAT